jgi:cytochrome c5
MKAMAPFLLAALVPGAALAEGAAMRTPQAIVRDTCGLCHGPGIGGAPRIGDERAWRKRSERGLDSLVRTAAEGKGAMPVRGGMPDLTEAELRAVVAYMAGLRGAEPR